MNNDRGSSGHNENARGNTAQQRMKEERIKRDQTREQKEPGKEADPDKPNKRER